VIHFGGVVDFIFSKLFKKSQTTMANKVFSDMDVSETIFSENSVTSFIPNFDPKDKMGSNKALRIQ
jgi:hypothetical protein